MTVTLVNPTHPYLRIFNPSTGEYASFVGGRLVIEEDDPAYGVVMEEASRNPYIAIVTSKFVCPECGAGFSKAGELADHRQELHFDAWARDEEAGLRESHMALVKSRAGLACDACAPAQVFPDEAALQTHISVVHTQSTKEEPIKRRRRPGEVEPVNPLPEPEPAAGPEVESEPASPPES